MSLPLTAVHRVRTGRDAEGDLARNGSIFVIVRPALGHHMRAPGCSLSRLERPLGPGNLINSRFNVSRP